MKKHLLKNLIWVLMLLACNLAWSQTRTVTGTVTAADDGLPLPGVSVIIKGTRTGTQTSAAGKFTITLPSGSATLVFSFIGYNPAEVPATAGADLKVKLVSSSKDLTEVVVTAYGQKRDKKALGYAVSTVGQKDLELRPEADIGRILNGKAPGLNILNTSGLSGSGTNITIRGISTITGSSQPLFVVDGVPFDGGTNAQANFTYGTQTSSRFLDLDPNNIESVNILKGLSATTLYGEAGRNGVILITTKNGSTQQVKGKTEISVSQSIFATKAILPEYNTEYGGGFDLSTGIAFYSNWGAKFQDPPVNVTHPYDRTALNSAFPQFKGAKYAYRYYNSVPNFFRTGYSKNTSVNIAGSAQNVNYNMSYSHVDETGYLIGNNLGKNNLGMGGTAKLTNKFTASGTFNYVHDNVLSPPTSNSYGNNATNTSVFGNVLYTPTAVDLIGLPYENPIDHSSVYYRSGNDIQNPIWTLYNSFTVDKTNRVFGQGSMKYDVTKNLNLLYRYGFDYYNEGQEYSQNKGGVSNATGILRTSSANNKISDNTLTLNYNKDFSDKYNINLIAGANSRDINYDQSGMTSTQQLVYGLMNQANFVNHGVYSEDGTALNYITHTRSVGAFAQGTFGYYDYLYLTAGARNSWSSTVEDSHRSIFYPSASLSFIPTSAIEALKGNKYINYLKLRLGYATSANFPFAYSTRSSLFTSTKTFLTASGTAINVNATTSLAPNPDLKPELSKEIEAGVEGKFFDNRVSVDFTVYKRISSDQILQQSLDPATGYTSQYVNAGKVTNKGIELAAGYTVIRGKNWRWQLDGQFTVNRSLVTDIPSSIGFINIAGYSNQGTIAQNGYPLGVIYGSYIQRDPATGERLVSTTGDYVTASGYKVIGNPNPKWKTTGISTISYKQFSFRMQWDYTYGGDIYSGTIGALLGRGVTKDTEFDRAKPLILPGVLANGQQNNIQISATQAYFNNNLPGGAPDESAIYDATNIRLREASFSYILPAGWFKKSPIGSVSLSVSGTNLFYYAPNLPKYTHFDPEASGLGVSNGRGMEFLSGPSARRFGGSIRVTF